MEEKIVRQGAIEADESTYLDISRPALQDSQWRADEAECCQCLDRLAEMASREETIK